MSNSIAAVWRRLCPPLRSEVTPARRRARLTTQQTIVPPAKSPRGAWSRTNIRRLPQHGLACWTYRARASPTSAGSGNWAGVRVLLRIVSTPDSQSTSSNVNLIISPPRSPKRVRRRRRARSRNPPWRVQSQESMTFCTSCAEMNRGKAERDHEATVGTHTAKSLCSAPCWSRNLRKERRPVTTCLARAALTRHAFR